MIAEAGLAALAGQLVDAVGLRLRAMLTDIQRGAAPDTHSWMRTLVPA